MRLKDCYQLGTIIRSHGVKGDVVIYLDVDEPSGYKKIKSVFLIEGDELKEWKLNSIRISDKLATVHLNGINDRNTSDLYIKKEVFLPVELLPSLKDKQFYFHEIIGFKLVDKSKGDLGPVTNVYELPQHPVLAIQYQNQEVLIPAVPDFIIAIDRERKTIEMDLPDGLIEIYTT